MRSTNKTTLLRLMAVTALFVALVAFPAAAGHGGGHGFSGTSEGESTATVDGTGVVETEFSGVTRGSSIGKGTYEGEAQQHWSPSFLPGAAPPCEDDNAGAWVTGDITITAANGDEIHGNLGDNVGDTDSYVCQIELNQEYTTHLVVEVEGGTGRFANATGVINSDGESHFREEVLPASAIYDDTATLSGELAYTASDRGRGKGK